ncbi:MAG: sodium:calcium antiporter [Pseudomonas sp.]|uniref:sodium:calcium antiporter n=1 Tax=Pseudomonas sp. TaxID=306 RepID=UPI003391BA87
MTPMTFVYLIIGLALLVVGAALLRRAAAGLATQWGLPARYIDLCGRTLGTTAPLLAVCLQAVLGERGDLAVGAVLGGTVANVLLVLGSTALLAPLWVWPALLRQELPCMVGSGLLALALAWDGSLSRLDGALLLGMALGYTGLLIRSGQWTPQVTPKPAARAWPMALLLLAAGIALLAGGAYLLVGGAIQLSRALGLSELLIGLTLVAVATALPLLVSSWLAALGGERGAVVSSTVGATVINLSWVLGLSALVSPWPLSVSPNALAVDFPVMIAVTLACLPLLLASESLRRWQGLLLLAYYATYVLYLAVFATGRPYAQAFAHGLQWYLLPATALLLLVLGVRAWRRRTRSGANAGSASVGRDGPQG